MSCKIITIDLANVPPIPIRLGVAGENTFRTITFDATEWGADFPGATYTVVYKRPDGYLYPVLVNAAADAIVWSPTGTDTATSGSGLLEVRLLDGETVGKTITMQTVVAPSLTGDESTPPQPAPDWVNDVAADADRAELAMTHYPKIVNGVWYVWSVQAEDFVSTGIDAQGEDGYSPTVTVTEIDGGHRVTITDADGAHPFDVMDGDSGVVGVDSVNGKTGAVVLDASDVGALPDDTPIPAAVTEQTVSGWGFTKNTGTYSKPSGGIPKTDLAQAVQTSLGKADSALQQHQSLAGYATETWVQNRGYQTASQVQTAVEGVATFEIPFTTTGLYAPWVFDSSKGVASVDIFDAVYAKRPIVARVETNGEVEIVPANLAQADKDTEYRSAYLEFWTFGDSAANNSEYFFVNMSVEPDAGDPTAEITVDSNHRVKKTLPAVTASDNGKFLRVVNGAWAAQTVPSAESNSFGGGA